MQENKDAERIDELIDRIDAFMANGGGHMNVKVKSEDGEVAIERCATCCGEFSDSACNTPAKE